MAKTTEKQLKAPRQRLYVDHCHTTGQIRGLLCQHCNTALGMVKDNIDTLSALISYLQEIKKKLLTNAAVCAKIGTLL